MINFGYWTEGSILETQSQITNGLLAPPTQEVFPNPEESGRRASPHTQGTVRMVEHLGIASGGTSFRVELDDPAESLGG